MERRRISIEEISQIISLKPDIVKDFTINGLNLCNRRTQYESIVSYVTNVNLLENVKHNKSIKVLVISSDLYETFKKELRDEIVFFISEDPESTFYKLHNELYYKTNFYDKYEFESQIGNNCRIHPSVVIENGVIIGDNVNIGPNSVVRSGSIIKNNVNIGCCSVIGSEGYQGIKINGVPTMIPHVGGTLLNEDVWIGDNSTIGNMLFEGYTIVGKNTKIDNHVHVAHNCIIGSNCFITASCLLMGSTLIDNNVWIAPNVLTMNRVHLGDNSFVGAMSLVTKDVEQNTLVVGIPAKKWRNL